MASYANEFASAEQTFGLPAGLLAAVAQQESGGNANAVSPAGAQGLMQVMSKIHHEKFQKMGGVQAALNPVANIRVGALILKDYVQRGGSVEAGLKTYVGAAAFETDSGYGSKVLAEYRRLKQVATGKNVPTITPAAPAQQQVAKVEKKADEVVHTDEAIAGAQRALWKTARVVAEPGGAAALSALLSRRYEPSADERVAVLVSGGNTAVEFA